MTKLRISAKRNEAAKRETSTDDTVWLGTGQPRPDSSHPLSLAFHPFFHRLFIRSQSMSCITNRAVLSGWRWVVVYAGSVRSS